MKTIASLSFDQSISSYVNTLYGYTFNIGNLSTFTLYNENTLVSKPTILNNFLPYLKVYANKIKVDEKYYQKPNLFALDYYGASELEWLVLYISGISHPIDFNVPYIYALPNNMLTDINKMVTLNRKTVEESKHTPKSYTEETIDIRRQEGFIEKRYTFKSDKHLVERMIELRNKNRSGRITTSERILERR